MQRLLLALALGVAIIAAAAGCGGGADAAAAPAGALELPRYFGRWYVIARTQPDGGVGAFREYRARPDGRIDALEHWRDGSFAGAVQTAERIAEADPADPRHWRVRTGWLGEEEQRILYVSPGYRHALIGDATRKAGWIIAREPDIPEWIYAGLVARLALQGYDVSRLRRVPQAPEQVGRPGFE